MGSLKDWFELASSQEFECDLEVGERYCSSLYNSNGTGTIF